MTLQQPGKVTGVNRGLQFYVRVGVSLDSAFPFDPDDPFVLRTVPSAPAVVITPPNCELQELELPAIDAGVLEEARQL